jgi:cytochrome c
MKKIIFIVLALTPILSLADVVDVYNQKCSRCHGIDGNKIALGKSQKISNIESSVIEGDLIAYKNGVLNKYRMGSLMQRQLADISNEEIKELSDYISTFK